jgi:hypothetical protein
MAQKQQHVQSNDGHHTTRFQLINALVWALRGRKIQQSCPGIQSSGGIVVVFCQTGSRESAAHQHKWLEACRKTAVAQRSITSQAASRQQYSASGTPDRADKVPGTPHSETLLMSCL